MHSDIKQTNTKIQIQKVWYCLLIFTLISILILAYYNFDTITQHHSIKTRAPTVANNHHQIVDDFFSLREKFELSELGVMLFKNYSEKYEMKTTFKILIWKNGNFLENRHILSFHNKMRNPFDNCSVTNCVLSYKDEDLDSAAAVVFHLHRTSGLASLPDPQIRRPPEQRWIFLTDESPYHTFLYANNSWTSYSGIFNWSMSYKMESDIPVPYGRTMNLEDTVDIDPEYPGNILEVVPYAKEKRRDVIVAIMISNCGGKNNRMAYINEMRKHMTVDVYGGCGDELKNKCPGHFRSDCPLLNNYLFYLAFENSNCDDYLTEKIFWNAYAKGAVPVIMGPSRENCKLLLPPNSFLHVRDYARPLDLVRHLKWLNNTWSSSFFSLHDWRRDFTVENEHGYYNTESIHYCRICEALNYNSKEEKVYNDLSKFLSVEKNCY